MLIHFLFTILLSQNMPQQTKLVGGPCEGCEAVFEYEDQKLSAVDTLPDFYEEGTRIRLKGTIFENDGTTPAAGVILYIYHTNQLGIYQASGDATGWEKRHGSIRGWIKTGKDGKYCFYTLKPGPYPNNTSPIHIHPVVLEQNGKYYWLNSYLFDEDPRLTQEYRAAIAPRGGDTGIMSLKMQHNILTGTRDIVLGKNIPGYD